jgi:hypothetical protein
VRTRLHVRWCVFALTTFADSRPHLASSLVWSLSAVFNGVHAHGEAREHTFHASLVYASVVTSVVTSVARVLGALSASARLRLS